MTTRSARPGARKYNDTALFNLAMRIQKHNEMITTLCNEIRESGNPQAENIVQSLRDNGFDNAANATHIVSDYLDQRIDWIAKTRIPERCAFCHEQKVEIDHARGDHWCTECLKLPHQLFEEIFFEDSK